MKKKVIIISISVIVAILLSAAVGTYSLLFSKPFKINNPTFIYIDDDDSADSVFTKIETNLHPESMTGIKMLAKLKNYGENIYTGAYKISPEMTVLETFRMLKAGRQTPVKLIIPSVRTIDKLVSRAAEQIMADSASIASLLNDSSYLANLGYDKATIPALFIPNTYEVYWNMTAEGFIKRMTRENKNFWNTERTAKAKALNMTAAEVCTLASIVDEETANNAEKPLVAGLYINRLKRGMLLQADPTVCFCYGYTLDRVLKKHLKIDSPYNTYKYKGLPPAPINVPPKACIDAVLNPDTHGYMYFCASPSFDGTHNFAVTYNEHLRNARAFQRALTARRNAQ